MTYTHNSLNDVVEMLSKCNNLLILLSAVLALMCNFVAMVEGNQELNQYINENFLD